MVLSLLAPAMAADEPAAPAAPVIADAPGKVVPAWLSSLADSGASVDSSTLSGKPYALVFVNGSCASCRKELAELSVKEFGDKLAVHIVSVDFSPKKAVTTYRDALNIKFPIMDDSDLELSEKFGFSFTPATVIVDASGKVETRIVGYNKSKAKKLAKAFAKYEK